ncbi:MAG TPA: zinc-dependent metalloprotease [Acidimicrobiales bacterium]|nr:zinc-dependent metalloprotease [Acidimicrobiales bacterium]
MSSPGPLGGNPFEGMPIFGDLAKLFTSQGPVNWEIARQMAQFIAVGATPEGNVDPLERIRLEELVRVAELHVGTETGLPTSVAGTALVAESLGRGEWAARTLQDYRDLFERLATSLGAPVATEPPHDAPPEAADFLGSLGQVLAPVMMGFQSGSMVGHLAQRAFGQYDLPIPRPPADRIVLVPANIDAFAADWSLPVDDLRLWVCLNEVAHHAAIGRPHVRGRLESLLAEYVSGFRPDAGALEARFGELDPTDPTSIQVALSDPESLLGALQTPEQQALLPRIEAVVCAVEGWVDHVMDHVGRRLIGSYPALSEALKRRRVERGEGDRFVERMLGLELGQAQYDRGAAFVRGVVDRAGDDALARLWQSERELPTPAEVDAPGLWLERIDLPD